MGRNAARELARIVGEIAKYLDRAEGDAGLSVSYEAIERATGVSRGHLSRRKEPEILALVSRIAVLKGSRHESAKTLDAARGPRVAPVAASGSPQVAGALSGLLAESLEKIVQRELREIARLQQQWTSRHARSEVYDAPLALHDADELLRRLRAAVERIRPVVAEWVKRQGVGGALPLEVGDDHGQESLSLEVPPL